MDSVSFDRNKEENIDRVHLLHKLVNEFVSNLKLDDICKEDRRSINKSICDLQNSACNLAIFFIQCKQQEKGSF